MAQLSASSGNVDVAIEVEVGGTSSTCSVVEDVGGIEALDSALLEVGIVRKLGSFVVAFELLGNIAHPCQGGI